MRLNLELLQHMVNEESSVFRLFCTVFATNIPLRSGFVRIQLNGEQRETAAATLQQLVIELGLEVRTIAIEYNREVAPRSRWSMISIAENDRIEIVQMIGGG